MESRTVLLSEIDPDPDQPRREMGELEGLAGSIRDRHQLQPIIVFQNGKRFMIIDGHRRFASLELAGEKEAMVLVLPGKPDTATLLETQLVANCLRKDLTPIEKASGIDRLKKLKNYNNAAVAKVLRMSEPMVTQCLSLLSWPPEIQSEIESGKIAPSTAYAITRAPDEETKAALLQAAREGSLTREDAIEAVGQNGASKTKLNRGTFCVSGASLTLVSEIAVTFKSLESNLKLLLRESRKASKQGIDIATFQRVLADQCRAIK